MANDGLNSPTGKETENVQVYVICQRCNGAGKIWDGRYREFNDCSSCNRDGWFIVYATIPQGSALMLPEYMFLSSESLFASDIWEKRTAGLGEAD